MPFHGVLADREWLFQPEPRKDIAVSDAAAWELYPQHRQVYNKLQLARRQGINAHPCSTDPLTLGLAAETPLFVKPIVNLQGMALEARQCKADQTPKDETLFWTPVYQGVHTSTDCLLLDGKVVHFVHSRSSVEKDTFRSTYWHIGIDLAGEEDAIAAFVETDLPDYTGICNLERIGDKVIEIHLRGSNGFYDLYPRDFIEAWIRLVDDGFWLPPEEITAGYLFSLFGSFPIRPDYEQIAEDLDVKIRPDPHTSDRVALIYADDKEKGERAIAFLRA